MKTKEECKYLGEYSRDCWKVSGNIFQRCMYANKDKCIILKNERLTDKINDSEKQLAIAKKTIEELKEKTERDFYTDFEIEKARVVDYECTCMQSEPTNCTKDDYDTCTGCVKEITYIYPPITAQVREKIEEVIISIADVVDLRIFKRDSNYIYFCEYSHEDMAYWEDGDNGEAKTRTEALTNLCSKILATTKDEKFKKQIPECFK